MGFITTGLVNARLGVGHRARGACLGHAVGNVGRVLVLALGLLELAGVLESENFGHSLEVSRVLYVLEDLVLVNVPGDFCMRMAATEADSRLA